MNLLNPFILDAETLEQHRSALERAGVRIVGPDWLAGFLAGLGCRTPEPVTVPEPAKAPAVSTEPVVPEPPAKPKRKPRAHNPNPSLKRKDCELCHEHKPLNCFAVGHSICFKCERRGAVVFEPGKPPRALDREMPSPVPYGEPEI